MRKKFRSSSRSVNKKEGVRFSTKSIITLHEILPEKSEKLNMNDPEFAGLEWKKNKNFE